MPDNKKSAWQEWKENLGNTRPWDIINPQAEKVDKEVAEKRLDICLACPEFFKATHQCKKCGCIMNLKVKLKDAQCPIGKW